MKLSRRHLLASAAAFMLPHQVGAWTHGSVGGSGVLWTPSQLGSAVVAWWDASDTANIALSGSKVTSWTSKIGGVVASQATSGAQPTWTANARNGKPGITASGAQSLGFNPASFPSGTSDFTAVVAGYMGSSGSTAAMFTYGNGTNLRSVYNNSSNFIVNTDNTNNWVQPQTWSGSDRLVVWNTSSADTQWGSSIDGVFNQITPGSVKPVTNTSGFMFAWIDGTTFPSSGTLQQVLVLNRVLTLSELRQVEGWESWADGKAGSNLPTNHPYKNAAPLVGDTFGTGPIRQAVQTTSYPGSTASANQAMTIQTVTFPYDIYNLQIVLPNFGTGTEDVGPGTFSATASIEDFSTGVAQQITFGGSATGTTTGPYLTSDLITLTNPKPLGTQHRIRVWVNSTGGTLYINNGWAGNGGFNTCAFGTTVADNTLDGGFPANTSSGFAYMPLIIAGRHNLRAFIGIGDSICHGQGTASNNIYGPGSGLFVPVMNSANVATTNFGCDGDSITQYMQNNTTQYRSTIANLYFTSGACDYGINDLNGGPGISTRVISATNAFLAQITFPMWMSTITMNCSSSDNFATAVNQVNNISAPDRGAINTQRRGLARFIDIASVTEYNYVSNTCLWRSPGDGSGATDILTATGGVWSGVHPTPYGYSLAWTVVNPAVFP